MTPFYFESTDEYWQLFGKSGDRHKLLTDISSFATHDYGSRSSQMMDYQQAAMQFLKEFIEMGCGQQDDVF